MSESSHNNFKVKVICLINEGIYGHKKAEILFGRQNPYLAFHIKYICWDSFSPILHYFMLSNSGSCIKNEFVYKCQLSDYHDNLAMETRKTQPGVGFALPLYIWMY